MNDVAKVPIVAQTSPSGAYRGPILHDRFQVCASTVTGFYVLDYDSPDGFVRHDERGVRGVGNIVIYGALGEARAAVEELRLRPAPTWKGAYRGIYREQLWRHKQAQDGAAAPDESGAREASLAEKLPRKGTPLRFVHDAVVAGDATEGLYKRLKVAYPQSKYQPGYVDWYRRQLAQRGALPAHVVASMEGLQMSKTPTTAKVKIVKDPSLGKEPKDLPKKEKAPRVTVSGRTRELVLAGKANAEIVAQLRKEGLEFKDASVAWYRMDMKKKGLLPKEPAAKPAGKAVAAPAGKRPAAKKAT